MDGISYALLQATKSAEAYDLDHAVLNTQRPQTMWLNMGLWKVREDGKASL